MHSNPISHPYGVTHGEHRLRIIFRKNLLFGSEPVGGLRIGKNYKAGRLNLLCCSLGVRESTERLWGVEVEVGGRCWQVKRHRQRISA